MFSSSLQIDTDTFFPIDDSLTNQSMKINTANLIHARICPVGKLRKTQSISLSLLKPYCRLFVALTRVFNINLVGKQNLLFESQSFSHWTSMVPNAWYTDRGFYHQTFWISIFLHKTFLAPHACHTFHLFFSKHVAKPSFFSLFLSLSLSQLVPITELSFITDIF